MPPRVRALVVVLLLLGLFGAVGARLLDAGGALAGAALLGLGLALGRGARAGPERPAPGAPPAAPDDGAAALLDALPLAAVLLDRRDLVLAANAPALDLLPALREGRPLAFALRDPAVLGALAAARAAGAPRAAPFVERVPVERAHDALLAPVGGEPGGRVLLTLADATVLRRAEALRADFVANASHELRTPLASLIGFIQTLGGAARDDAAARARFLPVMEAQAHRMSRLVDDLMSLSRVELRAHLRPRDAVDLAEVARQIAEGLAPLARARGVAVSVEAPGSVLVEGDRDELLRVAENLLDNAVKYGGGRATLAVAADPARGEATLSVRDAGPGIPPEHLPRLTERFWRAEGSASGGTGLGLAIVKHVLARHGGRLEVESRAGEGSVFRAVLPLPDAAAG